MMQGHPAVVSLLLSAGATVDATAKDGETPLMHACFNGHISCVEPLLAAGSCPPRPTVNHDVTLVGPGFSESLVVALAVVALNCHVASEALQVQTLTWLPHSMGRHLSFWLHPVCTAPLCCA